MIQFSIKSLILLTAVVAVYGLIVHAATRSQVWICLLGLVLYIALIRVVIRHVIKAENAHNARAKRSRDADESSQN
jgi:hypothetical protein